MRPFGIYKRSNGIYYGYLINPITGKRLPAKSTGTTDPQEAEFIVMGWRREGLYPGANLKQAITIDSAISVVKSADWQEADVKRLIDAMKARGFIESARLKGDGPDLQPLLDFLLDFWTYEKSPYVKERLAFGFSCHKKHINDNRSRIKNYWTEFFPESLKIGEIKRSDIQEFQIHLKGKSIANKTINGVINAGTLPLSWAADKGLITADPTVGLKQFALKSKKKGILTTSELEELFKPEHWRNEIARVAALLSSTTGLRLGEIRALQIQDIKMDRVTARHSYNRLDGLKALKNNDESRDTPLLPHVRQAIMDLINTNPLGVDPGTFVFFSTYKIGKADPVGENTINENFKIALNHMKVDWKGRNISFHSLRHGYTTALAGRVGLEALQGVVGHRDKAMTAHYSNHQLEENFTAVQKAAQEAFKGIVV